LLKSPKAHHRRCHKLGLHPPWPVRVKDCLTYGGCLVSCSGCVSPAGAIAVDLLNDYGKTPENDRKPPDSPDSPDSPDNGGHRLDSFGHRLDTFWTPFGQLWTASGHGLKGYKIFGNKLLRFWGRQWGVPPMWTCPRRWTGMSGESRMRRGCRRRLLFRGRRGTAGPAGAIAVRRCIAASALGRRGVLECLDHLQPQGALP